MKKQKESIPLLPLRDVVIYPHVMIPLPVGREKSIRALEEAIEKQTSIILATQKSSQNNNPQPEDIYSTGTLCSVIQLLRLPDGHLKALVEGKKRVKILDYTQIDPCFHVVYTELSETQKNTPESVALLRTIKEKFEIYVKLNRKIPSEILTKFEEIHGHGKLGDLVIAHLNIDIVEKQKILETTNIQKRLELILNFLISEVEILEVEKKIKVRVKDQIEKSQKEYYLNEQIQAIQKELGGKDDHQLEIEEFEAQLKKKQLTKKALDKINKEIKKLKLMSPMSAEATVVRNYISWVLELPWQHYSKEHCDFKTVKSILEKDHWGLTEAKERILESLSVRILKPLSPSPIICFNGPPGVGKTSLSSSIAEALGRKFVKISLGGVQDEAEIRGHRKTYVGAMPGKIIQAFRKAGSSNPVILLDEIDKMSVDFRGDPASALLEVLDHEQNKIFEDHYLELEYDLSKAMFITTSNSTYPISPPLLDRMEVIDLDGYIEQEKINIAKKYLVPKQLNKSGLNKFKVSFSEKALTDVIRYYTRESGVRQVERLIQKICQKLAKKIITKYKISSDDIEKKRTKLKKIQPFSVTGNLVHTLLGDYKFKNKKADSKGEIGVTNGLAWTNTGGDLLPLEVSVVEGKGKFILTGSLGDVMKESCTASLSYVRSRGDLLGFDKEYFENTDIHIHAPEGAIPKDGPSAGITMTTSIVSAITKIPVKKHIAMTGEITLRGRVLEIGGLKQKILAAHRGGIKTILIPKDNKNDLKTLPKEVLKNLKIILVDHIDQVLVNALNIKNAKMLFKNNPLPKTKIKAQHTGHSLH